MKRDDFAEAAGFLSGVTGGLRPDIALILGTGLGELAQSLETLCTVPYARIPGFASPGAPGHAGNLIFCRQGDRTLAVMQGRHHYYEGRSMEEIVFPLRVLGMLGAGMLIVTNASGGINLDFKPGDIMLIEDHIKFAPDSPLRGENLDFLGPRFPDMTYAYTPELQEAALRAARKLGMQLKRGVYMYMTGPQYETPAEIRAIRALGADCVGMSTVPEVIAASHMGMSTLGFSLISNAAAGVTGNRLTQEEVFEAGEAAKEKFTALIVEVLKEIDIGHTF